MRFGSVCSGIEAASVAWHPLGWRAAWLAEIEPFPCAVLAHHYPEVPNLGDMTAIREHIDAGEVEAPDLLCGGTPCQAFSVAGLRQSLSDERGNLSLEFIRIADAIDRVRCAAGKRPAWIVWENVPGVLSTSDNAFGAFLGGLCGADTAIPAPATGWPSAGVVDGPQRVVAWRVLDAQFFGVAQRRKRVFVLALGGAGKWACADALLPISDRMHWHPAPRRQAGQRVAPTVEARARAGGGGWGTDFLAGGGLAEVAGTLQAGGKAAGSATQQDAESGPLVAAFGGNDTSGEIPVAAALNANRGCHNPGDFEAGTLLTVAHSLRGEGFDASEDGTGRGTPLVPVQVFTGDGQVADPISAAEGKTYTHEGTTFRLHNCIGEVSPPAMQVRRLTPRECERLQGFPDDYTRIPTKKAKQITAAELLYIRLTQPDMPMEEAMRLAADGPRYKALGNSWAVPCARWIGQQIQRVQALQEEAHG